MKKFGIAIIFLVSTTFAVSLLKSTFLKYETMAPSKAEKIWGNEKFDPQKFKSGDETVKAKMAASAVKEKVFVGKKSDEVRRELGDADGYYFSDAFVAYVIDEKVYKKNETWQLLFMTDENQVVTEVVIHKNCCYK